MIITPYSRRHQMQGKRYFTNSSAVSRGSDIDPVGNSLPIAIRNTVAEYFAVPDLDKSASGRSQRQRSSTIDKTTISGDLVPSLKSLAESIRAGRRSRSAEAKADTPPSDAMADSSSIMPDSELDTSIPKNDGQDSLTLSSSEIDLIHFIRYHKLAPADVVAKIIPKPTTQESKNQGKDELARVGASSSRNRSVEARRSISRRRRCSATDSKRNTAVPSSDQNSSGRGKRRASRRPLRRSKTVDNTMADNTLTQKRFPRKSQSISESKVSAAVHKRILQDPLVSNGSQRSDASTAKQSRVSSRKLLNDRHRSTSESQRSQSDKNVCLQSKSSLNSSRRSSIGSQRSDPYHRHLREDTSCSNKHRSSSNVLDTSGRYGSEQSSSRRQAQRRRPSSCPSIRGRRISNSGGYGELRRPIQKVEPSMAVPVSIEYDLEDEPVVSKQTPRPGRRASLSDAEFW